MYRNVIVAYDDTDGAKAALERAVEIAARNGASLTLVEALAESHPALVPGGPRTTGPKEAAEGRKQLKEAVDALESSLQASPWVVGAPEGKAILDVLWWPPHKISGRYLAPFLYHGEMHEEPEPPRHSLYVEVALPYEWHEQPQVEPDTPPKVD